MSNPQSVLFFAALMMVLSFTTLVIGIIRRSRLRAKSELMNSLFGDLDINIIPSNVNGLDLLKNDRFGRLLGKRYRDSLREKLSKSGKIGDEFVENLAKRKVLIGLFALIIGLMYFADTGGYFNAILAGLAGFFLPDLLLTNTIQKRGEEIESALPDAVEMLTMCVEAGLTFQQALGKVAENQKSVISTEFARVMSEIQIGEARSDSLDGMADRLNHPDVKKFVSAMHQVDRLGIPISTVLKEQVKELRGKSKDRAREKAQKVPVKILGPVMVCFLPSVLIIVIGPVILQAISAFQQ